jgi:hypothetical protein
MDIKDLKGRIVEKEIMLEVKYDDFELNTVGIVKNINEFEEGIKIFLENKTSVYTTFDYLIEDEDTIFFMERISDNQELILAMLKILD